MEVLSYVIATDLLLQLWVQSIAVMKHVCNLVIYYNTNLRNTAVSLN
jgi:hypothetical protein